MSSNVTSQACLSFPVLYLIYGLMLILDPSQSRVPPRPTLAVQAQVHPLI